MFYLNGSFNAIESKIIFKIAQTINLNLNLQQSKMMTGMFKDKRNIQLKVIDPPHIFSLKQSKYATLYKTDIRYAFSS
jgi:hypothetical protein